MLLALNEMLAVLLEDTPADNDVVGKNDSVRVAINVEFSVGAEIPEPLCKGEAFTLALKADAGTVHVYVTEVVTVAEKVAALDGAADIPRETVTEGVPV